MTPLGDPGPPGRWRRRAPAAVLALVAVVALLLVAASGLKGALTYYRTPSEVAGAPISGTTVRLGGLVAPGSVERDGRQVSFTLTDGARDLHVVSRDQPPGTFRAGQGAVVEGSMRTDGIFVADQIIVRHSNEYRPPVASGP